MSNPARRNMLKGTATLTAAVTLGALGTSAQALAAPAPLRGAGGSGIDPCGPSPSGPSQSAELGPLQSVELFADGESIGWLGWGGFTGTWCVVTSSLDSDAASVQSLTDNGVLYYQAHNGSLINEYLSVSRHNYVGAYHWIGATGWTVNGNVMTSLYTGDQLSYRTDEAPAYVYAYSGSGYTPLTVEFHSL